MKKIILSIILSAFCLFGFSQNSGVEKFADIEEYSTIDVAELKVYPNPCKQEKVTIESDSNNITEVGITNIAGKQVYLKKYFSPENKIQIELTEMPNGVYLVKIKTNDNKQVVKKLIVAKQ